MRNWLLRINDGNDSNDCTVTPGTSALQEMSNLLQCGKNNVSPE